MITVVPLYYPSDVDAHQLFSVAQSELDAISGRKYFLVCSPQLSAKDVSEAVDSQRYPGLKHESVPCLWIETTEKRNFVLRLRGISGSEISRRLRLLSDLVNEKRSFDNIKEKLMALNDESATAPKMPTWFPKAGYGSLILTLVFLISLVVADTLGFPVRDSSRMLVVFVLAIGISAAASFVGGDAAAKGTIPFPFAKESPVTFSVSGGIAAFVITLLIGYYAYGKTA